jgi:hypothetical protein
VSRTLSARASGPVVLENLPLRVDPDEVLRFQGYKKGLDVPSAEVRAIFDEALALGESLMVPRAVYRASPVTDQGPHSIDTAGVTLTIPDIEHLWGRLAAVGAGICTVGDAIEVRVRALFDAREFPLAVMLDSVGDKVTNRVSPGYAGWDTAEQRRLFALCSGAPIGVTLNEACFMLPAKTITFLVGVGPEARVDHYFTQCRRCWMRDCAYRRVPAATTVRR